MLNTRERPRSCLVVAALTRRQAASVNVVVELQPRTYYRALVPARHLLLLLFFLVGMDDLLASVVD